MPSDAAELSSLAASLEELRNRVTSIAARHEQPPNDEVLGSLYDAERSLRAAIRKVETAASRVR